MSLKYADRAFVTFQGQRLVDVESASVKINRNAKVVPTMTPDAFNRGFVQGNMDIDVDFTIAVQNLVNMPKLGSGDFENNDVALTFLVGADVYIVSGLFAKSEEKNAGGVGEAVKASFSFGALKFTDQTGISALFNLSL